MKKKKIVDTLDGPEQLPVETLEEAVTSEPSHEASPEVMKRVPSDWMKRKKIKDFIHAGAAKRAKWRGDPITEADYDKAVTGFLKNPPSGKK